MKYSGLEDIKACIKLVGMGFSIKEIQAMKDSCDNLSEVFAENNTNSEVNKDDNTTNSNGNTIVNNDQRHDGYTIDYKALYEQSQQQIKDMQHSNAMKDVSANCDNKADIDIVKDLFR